MRKLVISFDTIIDNADDDFGMPDACIVMIGNIESYLMYLLLFL